MKYKILTANDAAALEEIVMDFLEHDWRLQGGVSVSTYEDVHGYTLHIHSQAVVKDK